MKNKENKNLLLIASIILIIVVSVITLIVNMNKNNTDNEDGAIINAVNSNKENGNDRVTVNHDSEDQNKQHNQKNDSIEDKFNETENSIIGGWSDINSNIYIFKDNNTCDISDIKLGRIIGSYETDNTKFIKVTDRYSGKIIEFTIEKIEKTPETEFYSSEINMHIKLKGDNDLKILKPYKEKEFADEYQGVDWGEYFEIQSSNEAESEYNREDEVNYEGNGYVNIDDN